MNAVVTPLDPFPTGNQQNPFIFCDAEDHGSDVRSDRHSGDYSFENSSNGRHNTVDLLSFLASQAAGSVERTCAPVFGVSNEEEAKFTASMPPSGAVKSKGGSPPVNDLDGIPDEVSTSLSNSDIGRGDKNGGENNEKSTSCLKTHCDVSSSVQETEVKADVKTENISVETSYDNKDNVPPDNDREGNVKLRKDSVSDVTSARAKRGSRRHRCQNSTKKKWKCLDAQEMGFHLSSFPRLPTESDESESATTEQCTGLAVESSTVDDSKEASENEHLAENSTDCSDEDSSNRVSSSELRTNSRSGSNPVLHENNEKNDHDAADEDLDDVTFFAFLGVDVHDSYEFVDDADDIWQWDGVRFDNPSFLSSGSSKNRRPNTSTKSKSDLPVKPWLPESYGKKKPVRAIHVMYNKYVCNMSKRGVAVIFDSGCISSTKTYLRPDRHRRAMKCHKAVKSKNARASDLAHNPGKKQLYIHHRLVKLLNIDSLRHYSRYLRQPTAMPKVKVDRDWIKGIRVNKPQAGQSRPSPHTSAPPPQNLNHVLADTNVPGDFEMDLVSFLLAVQNRDLTPEDYEMLLRLDDSVQAKTISKSVLDSLKTETIGEGDAVIDSMCAICMEPYVAGQVRKFLPCQHDFHLECIDTWLNNSSQNCPLDGLPVDGS